MKRLYIFSLLLSLVVLFDPQTALAQNFKVVIDPGHGGKDPGAVGKVGREKSINLAVALKLGKLIKSKHEDTEVLYTRSTDKFVELSERANIANRSKANLFISIHTNATKTTSVKGTETFTLGLKSSDQNLEVAKLENSAILLEDDYQVRYEGFDPKSSESYIMFELMQDNYMSQSIEMASFIQDQFKSTAKRGDRGVRQAPFLVLRNTGMPSVLVELGFITNAEEERYLLSESGQNNLAQSIYKAFVAFKSDYDKKSGKVVIAPPPVSNASKSSPVASSQSKPASSTKVSDIETKSSGEVLYRVQIFTHPQKLPNNSSYFKGLKGVDHYREKGAYKYTYGASVNKQEVDKIRREISSKFKDAFVIKTIDGKRIN
ncbi:MAG: N-acetylmuramoyl-L-alanine amidase family protein [Bacteroidales bacterium]